MGGKMNNYKIELVCVFQYPQHEPPKDSSLIIVEKVMKSMPEGFPDEKNITQEFEKAVVEAIKDTTMHRRNYPNGIDPPILEYMIFPSFFLIGKWDYRLMIFKCQRRLPLEQLRKELDWS